MEARRHASCISAFEERAFAVGCPDGPASCPRELFAECASLSRCLHGLICCSALRACKPMSGHPRPFGSPAPLIAAQTFEHCIVNTAHHLAEPVLRDVSVPAAGAGTRRLGASQQLKILASIRDGPAVLCRRTWRLAWASAAAAGSGSGDAGPVRCRRGSTPCHLLASYLVAQDATGGPMHHIAPQHPALVAQRSAPAPPRCAGQLVPACAAGHSATCPPRDMRVP